MSRGEKVIVKCLTCKTPFSARVADRKRGWGRYCSKSCKAIKQTQRTGRGAPRYSGYHADEPRPLFPGDMSSEALGQWDD